MIITPKRGECRRFLINWRWSINAATMRDIDDLAHGNWRQVRRANRRLLNASMAAKLVCAGQIAADFEEQVSRCLPSAKAAQGNAGAGSRGLAVRNIMEICRTTGLTPQQQYEQLTYLEFEQLMVHCNWVQGVQHQYYAADTGRRSQIPYPQQHIEPGGSAHVDGDRLQSVFDAWNPNPDTVH